MTVVRNLWLGGLTKCVCLALALTLHLLFSEPFRSQKDGLVFAGVGAGK